MQPPPTILIVEDHGDTLVMTGRLLEREGYRVCLASTWADAARRCEGGGIDLMLLDIGLPDITVPDLLAALKTCPVRTLILSGYAQPQEIQASLDAGALAYLVKPIGADRLLAAVRSATGQPAAQPAPPPDADSAPGPRRAARPTTQPDIA